ncbi:MAG: phenylalanine--tRNA ligase subunit beta [Holosporaceae bacterium]|jgi:phenylalanyl-tRNA synthetase beta chain|nr:phenylalanine--tRNA ligase subunit beta [Holosporaceae bacterium]
MRFTFNWLKRHLETDWDIYQIAKKLTTIGLEVDNFCDPKIMFRNFKLACIEHVEQHPNADRLKRCVVADSHGKKWRIICGASNVHEGLIGVLALPGAIIPSTGEVLSRSKIRGIESEGMLCSYDELSLPSDDANGIIDLGPNVSLSTSVGDALGFDGGILDVSITPNRGDCFSLKGIARDLAAAGAGKFIVSDDISSKSSFEFPLHINYEKSDACRRYAPVIAFRVIRGIKNDQSPDWLRSLFLAIGQNSVSSVVDLANLWLIDSGRPLHVYDLNKISGQLAIRFAKNKEKFFDIKGREYILHQDMLVAADEKNVLCLLGVMGGAKTACDENTTDILLESGLFDPIFISRTGTFLDITSDSRTRFERGIDRDSCISGLETITRAIIDVCGGTASNICIVGTHPNVDRSIRLTEEKLHRLSGYEIDWANAKKILLKLGLKEVSSSSEASTFLVPSWRSDLSIEEDLIEEILRITGYDNSPEEKFDAPINCNNTILQQENIIMAVKRLLASCGLSEVVSYSFIKSTYADAFKEKKKVIQLLNPISEDLSTMRPSLIPGLILAATRSLNYGQSCVELCESGNVFYDACLQETHIAGLRAGDFQDRSWIHNSRKINVFDAKSDLMTALGYFGLTEKEITIKQEAPSYYHPSRSGTVYLGKKKMGYFGELHPKINKLFAVSEVMACFELITENCDISPPVISYKDKVFPKINRDFSFIFDTSVAIGTILASIYRIDKKITKADVFDSFILEDGKKSIGITVTLDAIDRTLTEEEAQIISGKIIKFVEEAGGELRKK